MKDFKNKIMKTLIELLKEKIDNDEYIDGNTLESNWFAEIYYIYHDKEWYEVTRETLTVGIDNEGFEQEDEIEWKISDDFDFVLFKETFGEEIEEIEEKYISEHRDDQLEKLGL